MRQTFNFEEDKTQKNSTALKDTRFVKLFGKVWFLLCPIVMLGLFVYAFMKNPEDALNMAIPLGIAILILILSATGSWDKLLKVPIKVGLEEARSLMEKGERLAAVKRDSSDALSEPSDSSNSIKIEGDAITISHNNRKYSLKKQDMQQGEYAIITDYTVNRFDLYFTIPCDGTLLTMDFCGIPMGEEEALRAAMSEYPFKELKANSGSSLGNSLAKEAQKDKKKTSQIKESVSALIFGSIFTGISILFISLSGGLSKGNILDLFAEVPMLILVIMFLMIGLYMLFYSIMGFIYAIINFIKR